MLQRFLFYICFIMGIVSATQIINENNSNTNLKLEQIKEQVQNIISDNTYSGLSAITQINSYKRC